MQQNGQYLAEDVLTRFNAASRVTPDEVVQEQLTRQAAIDILEPLLADDAIMVMPTVPGPAPLCSSPEEVLTTERQQVQQLVSAAGLAGLPQVTLPWIEVDGAPVGLSVMGAEGNDGSVALAAKILHAVI